MARNTAQEVVQKLYLAGQMIELDARRSIVAGSVSGAGHVPSRPNEPPNNDTGLLQNNISTEIRSSAIPVVAVVSRAPYAAVQEYGSSRQAPRPYLRPATERNRDEVTRLVGEAVSIVVKRG